MPYNQPVPRYVIRTYFDLTLPYHIKGTGINTEGEAERDKERQRTRENEGNYESQFPPQREKTGRSYCEIKFKIRNYILRYFEYIEQL